MSDRNLITYEEPRNEFGPYWRLKIDRSSAGQPGILLTIGMEMFDPKYAHLNREMTIVVNDAWEVLNPVLDWLNLDSAPLIARPRNLNFAPEFPNLEPYRFHEDCDGNPLYHAQCLDHEDFGPCDVKDSVLAAIRKHRAEVH